MFLKVKKATTNKMCIINLALVTGFYQEKDYVRIQFQDNFSFLTDLTVGQIEDMLREHAFFIKTEYQQIR